MVKEFALLCFALCRSQTAICNAIYNKNPALFPQQIILFPHEINFGNKNRGISTENKKTLISVLNILFCVEIKAMLKLFFFGVCFFLT